MQIGESLDIFPSRSIAGFVMVPQFSSSQLLNCYIWRTLNDRHALNFYHHFLCIPKTSVYISDIPFCIMFIIWRVCNIRIRSDFFRYIYTGSHLLSDLGLIRIMNIGVRLSACYLEPIPKIDRHIA